MAKITVSYLRDLERQRDNGEISYGRMVELLNERAFDASEQHPKEAIVAVVATRRSDFEKYVSEIYGLLPIGKSISITDYTNCITIEFPQGVKTKYHHFYNNKSIIGYFDKIEILQNQQ